MIQLFVRQCMPSPMAHLVAYRTEGHWFDPQLGQYSFQGLMIWVGITDCQIRHWLLKTVSGD